MLAQLVVQYFDQFQAPGACAVIAWHFYEQYVLNAYLPSVEEQDACSDGEEEETRHCVYRQVYPEYRRATLTLDISLTYFFHERLPQLKQRDPKPILVGGPEEPAAKRRRRLREITEVTMAPPTTIVPPLKVPFATLRDYLDDIAGKLVASLESVIGPVSQW